MSRQGAGGQEPRHPAPGVAHPVEGLGLGEAATVRSGEDARRRGWFWHWNSIVTQYAPLIGLKGVGLLNSYTVWTDRREESPHRGYAFPSQQSEADFYGEDRAELIAINKILVALDLIEIRKEMVLRTDPQGRRWRVPHNFYRVKDHGDGFGLTARDVLRVADLADRDKAVYRLVRRVFSPRFAPIDGDNVWHRILPEVRQTDLWQRLAARAAREEDRASARTRAGHAARRAAVADAPGGDFFVPTDGDDAATTSTRNDTATDDTSPPLSTSVATTNRGSKVGVAPVNDGSTGSGTTSVGPSNDGGPTAVAPSNTTYNQSGLTTTTTRRGAPKDVEESATASLPPQDELAGGGDRAGFVTGLDETERAAVEYANVPASAGPGGAAPADAAGEAAAFRAFAEANDRPATPAERTLLRRLAERFEPAAAAAGRVAPHVPASGWAWIAAAVYEAVEAGSAFVAPRRLREILARWERDGFPAAEDGDGSLAPTAGGGGASDGGVGRTTASRLDRAGRPSGAVRAAAPRGVAASRDVAPSPGDLLGRGPDLPLPHGHGSRRTWAFVVGLLGEVLDPAALADLVAGSAIVGYRDGEVTVAVPDPARAERLATTHRELVARKLSEAMRRPIRLAVVTSNDGHEAAATGSAAPSSAVGTAPPPTSADDPGPEPAVPSFPVEECGLPSDRVWAAVLAELADADGVGRANFDAWLRPTALVGRGGGAAAGSPLVVGVPHALAQRRVAARFGPALRAAVAAVVGAPLAVEVVVARDWLAAHPVPPPDAPVRQRVGA